MSLTDVMVTLEIKNHFCTAHGTGSAVIDDVMHLGNFTVKLVHTEEHTAFVDALTEP